MSLVYFWKSKSNNLTGHLPPRFFEKAPDFNYKYDRNFWSRSLKRGGEQQSWVWMSCL